MKKLVMLFFAFTVFFATSCKKEFIDPVIPPADQNLSNIKVPAGFDWKTTKDYQLTLSGSTSGIISVAATNGTVYQKAFLNQGQIYTMKLTVPSTETTIILKFKGQDVSLNLTSANLSYQFN